MRKSPKTASNLPQNELRTRRNDNLTSVEVGNFYFNISTILKYLVNSHTKSYKSLAPEVPIQNTNYKLWPPVM